MSPQKAPHCPHCGETLRAFSLPDNTGWEQAFQLACFNNDCGYFRKGWDWMYEQFGVRASYRYRVDPATGKDSPLAVWSETALVDRIIGDATFECPAPRDASDADDRGDGE